MKKRSCRKLLATATGVFLVLLTFSSLEAKDIRVNPIPLGSPIIQPLNISSAPGYCESNGGSHEWEYILDAQYTRMTEDTISITVEIYIANPNNCTSGRI